MPSSYPVVRMQAKELPGMDCWGGLLAKVMHLLHT
jgi:hypothetical protein